MKNRQLVKAFTALSSEEKIAFLLRFAHTLTVMARDTYDSESDGLTSPTRMRILNEIQHRVLSFVLALVTNNTHRYPDDVLVGIMLDHPEDVELQRQVHEAFRRLYSQGVVTE